MIALYSMQISANSLTCDETDFGRSCMCKRNNNGSSTVPWGTPQSTYVNEEGFHIHYYSSTSVLRNYLSI